MIEKVVIHFAPVMPTNPARTRVVLPRTLDQRLRRIEDLLIEMRFELDVVLKKQAKAQVQLDALAAKSQRGARPEFLPTETENPPSSIVS